MNCFARFLLLALGCSLAADAQITLTWTPVAGATYTVLRAPAPCVSYAVLASGLTANVYTDTNPPVGACYQVSETLAVANLIATSPLPDTTPPTTPADLTATGWTSSQIRLTWSASVDPVVSGALTSGLSGYHIYRDGVLLTSVAAATNAFTDNGLPASTTHLYVLSAYDLAGNVSAPTAPVPGTTTNVAGLSAQVYIDFEAGSDGATATATLLQQATTGPCSWTGASSRYLTISSAAQMTLPFAVTVAGVGLPDLGTRGLRYASHTDGNYLQCNFAAQATVSVFGMMRAHGSMPYGDRTTFTTIAGGGVDYLGIQWHCEDVCYVLLEGAAADSPIIPASLDTAYYYLMTYKTGVGGQHTLVLLDATGTQQIGSVTVPAMPGSNLATALCLGNSHYDETPVAGAYLDQDNLGLMW